MKAILVIDMPKSCEECDYCGFYQDDVDERACLLMEGHFIGKLTEGEKNVACPLKPMPQKVWSQDLIERYNIDESKYTQSELTQLAYGYNTCIDEILGETE